jgi:hypothetical protein
VQWPTRGLRISALVLDPAYYEERVHHADAIIQTPQLYAAYGYEAMNVALDAITHVGTKDRVAIREAITVACSAPGRSRPAGDSTTRR